MSIEARSNTSPLTRLVDQLEEMVNKGTVGVIDKNDRKYIKIVDATDNGVFYFDENFRRKLENSAATAFKNLQFNGVSEYGKKKLFNLASDAVEKIEAEIEKISTEVPNLNEEIRSIKLESQKDLDLMQTKFDILQLKLKTVEKLKNHLAIAQAALENKSLNPAGLVKPQTTLQKTTQIALYVLSTIGVAAIGYAIRSMF